MSASNGATWRSGYAAVCKTVYSGSIPDVASIPSFEIPRINFLSGLRCGTRRGAGLPSFRNNLR
jgi:hypothetical protein